MDQVAATPVASETTWVDRDDGLRDVRDQYAASFTSANTARAYRADLAHLARWQADRGESLRMLTETSLLRYLRSLHESGASHATIRRRITCLRGFVTFGQQRNSHFFVDVDAARVRYRHLARAGRVAARSVLLLSDDPFIKSGIRQTLEHDGLLEVTALPLHAMHAAATLPRCDYALVHLAPTTGLDRYAGVEALSAIRERELAMTTLVVAAPAVSELVRLRVTEAGAAFVYPYAQLAADPAAFAQQLRDGALDESRRLPSQWAQRQALGLRWNGLVEPFLDTAGSLPSDLWTTQHAVASLPVSRAILRDLQRRARDGAGLPPPRFAMYATSVRRPPEFPLWPTVRSFVRELWGLPR